MSKLSDSRRLPTSVTSFRINLVALACFLAGLYAGNQSNLFASIASSGQQRLVIQMLALMACWSIPVIVLEVFFRPRIGGFDPSKLSISRALYKVLGLVVTLAVCAFVYWVFPEYHGSFYEPYWAMLTLLAPVVLVGCIPYFYLTDGFVDDPKDSYLTLGQWVLGRASEVDRNQMTQHWLGWLVKGFFLPLMTVYLYKATAFFAAVDISTTFSSFVRFYDFAWELIFAVDLVIVTAGYILALKLLDSHIRSAEPTALGWLVAIVCYQPFWSAISVGYLAYNKDNYQWGAWLSGSETLTMIWGSLILVLITIYSLSSVAFGIRFSNLTHRGIITTGPYRYTKHPAYLSKNLSWWMISIPFVTNSGDWTLIIQCCAMLLGLNFIYFMRAVTEERHLSRDPDYRAYQLAMGSKPFWGRWENLTGSASEVGEKSVQPNG